MSVTLTYDATLSRVRITANDLAAADVAAVERTTDGIRWTTVRGASAVPVVSGRLQTTVDDYEFPADTLTTYRVRGVETAAATFVGVGTAGAANNAAVAPGLPTAIAPGDLLLGLTSIRNSGTGTPTVPADWTTVTDAGNVKLIAQRFAPANTDGYENGVTSYVTTACAYVASAAHVRTGLGAAMMTVTGSPGTAFARRSFPVAAGSFYYLSVWCYSVAGYADVNAGIDWYDGSGVYISSSTAGGSAAAAATWVERRVPNAQAPVGAVTGRVGPTLGSTPTGQVLWADDLVFGLAPTQSWTYAGGVANADTFGRIAAFRRASSTALTSAALLNASAANIAYPAVAVTEDAAVIIVAAWRQDDWTSVATLAGMTEISESTSTTGDDASQAWDYVIQTTAANIPAGSFVPTGGAAAISRGITAAFPHATFLNEQTSTITAALDGIWLKSIARPFLNRKILVTDYSAVARAARVGVFDIIGASAPVAVNDVRGSKRFSLEVMTATGDDEANLDLVLSSGDPMFVHVSPSCRVPGGYVTIGETSAARHTPRATRRFFDLPCQVIAAPGPDVVGAALTWQTVLNTYPTWRALIAAHSSWASLLTLIGSPGDVIVGVA